MNVKVIQLCLTLCNPMDYTAHGILQARLLEWVAFHSPGDLPNPGIKPRSPTLQADSLPAELPRKPHPTSYFPEDMEGAGWCSRTSKFCVGEMSPQIPLDLKINREYV